jgi:hypothetical protein
MFEKKEKQAKKVKMKLELNRETLRNLSNAELAEVAGGAKPESEFVICGSDHRGGCESLPTCV